MRSSTRSPIAIAVTAALTASCVAPLAGAQEAPSQPNSAPIAEVVVTGSNIRRVDSETASPIQVVSQEEIQRTGKTTLADYLQTLTADGAGSVPKTFGTGFSAGGAGISLRGLGAGSTLVLMNGRRIAPYGLADDGQKVFTDLSVVPLEAVERVEVLKDGASAIYGSDAIAGVVNIILRKEFNGFTGKGSFASSRYSDGNTGKVSATYGFGSLADNRYNVYFNVEASDSDRVRISDRRDRDYLGTGDLRPYGGSVTGSQFLFGFITPGAANNMPTGALQNPATGEFVALPGCAQFSTLAPDPNGGCLWEAGQFRYITPDERYINGFGRGTFQLSDSTQLYTELSYSHKEAEFHTTPSGTSGGWGFPGGAVNASSGPGAIVVGANHPDNPYGQAVRLRYSAFDLGPRAIDNENDFWRALAGVQMKLGGWDVDAGYLHSEGDLKSTRNGYIRYSALRAALTDPTSSLYPYRIGGNANLNTQAQYDAISPTIHADGKTVLDLVDIKGSRSLAPLPGGDLGIAIGAEYRHLEANLTPQTFTDQGDIVGLGFSAYEGTTNVAGAYLELLAPVVRQLELSAAVRVDSYMNGASATTPKFGIKYRPFEQLALRATFARGFRAPNPAEAGKGGLAGFANTADPVRCADGAPAPGASEADCNLSVAAITAPNPALKPEKSRSVTAGLIFQPVSDASLSLDVWEIKRTNEINTETLQEAISQGKTVRADNLLNGVPDTGTLLAAFTDYINSASTRVRGGDVDARYTLRLENVGSLRFDLQFARITSFVRTEVDGSQLEFAGTHGNCDVTNCIGTPKNRINFGTTWNRGPYSLSTVVNFIDSFRNVDDASQKTCNNRFADGSNSPNADCRIPSFYSVDLSGSWAPTESLEVFGTVENLFDRQAPLDQRTYGAVNYNPMHWAGAIGRYYTVGMKYSFD